MVTPPRARDAGAFEVPLDTVLISFAVFGEVPDTVIDPPATLLLEEMARPPLLIVVPPV